MKSFSEFYPGWLLAQVAQSKLLRWKKINDNTYKAELADQWSITICEKIQPVECKKIFSQKTKIKTLPTWIITFKNGDQEDTYLDYAYYGDENHVTHGYRIFNAAKDYISHNPTKLQLEFVQALSKSCNFVTGFKF